MNTRRHLQYAGSIFELIIALGLIALLSIVSIPSIKDQRTRLTLQAERDRLVSDLKALSLTAIRTEQTLSLLSLEHSYRAYKYFVSDSPVLIRDRSLQYSLESNLSGPVIFYPSGACTPASLTLSAEKHRCTITLSLRGRITSTCQDE